MQSSKFRKLLPEFVEFLARSDAFEDPDCGRMYDTGLVAGVIGACLDNLRMHGTEGIIEQIPLYLDKQQKETFATICTHLHEE